MLNSISPLNKGNIMTHRNRTNNSDSDKDSSSNKGSNNDGINKGYNAKITHIQDEP